MEDDPYREFADRYDHFYGGFGRHDGEQVEFLKRLLERTQAQRLLDCACGTGNDLDLLYRLGYEAIGSDVSIAMLRRANHNLGGKGPHPPLLRADFRALPFQGDTFDVVLCLTTSLPHLPDELQVALALEDMRRVLRPGGILVLSQGLTDRLLVERPRFEVVINTVDLSRLFLFNYPEGRVRIDVLDLIHEPGRSAVEVDRFEYLALLQDDYRRLLQGAGYVRTEFFSGYRFEPYDPGKSDRLAVVAYK